MKVVILYQDFLAHKKQLDGHVFWRWIEENKTVEVKQIFPHPITRKLLEKLNTYGNIPTEKV